MVLKKTNCHRVNSGNTMRKRYARLQHAQNFSRMNLVLKSCLNILPELKHQQHGQLPDPDQPMDTPREIKDATSPFEVAKNYFDDGGLSIYSPRRVRRHFWGNLYEFMYFSLNKRKRWLLEKMMADVVGDEDLATEGFKLSLVKRQVACGDSNIQRHKHQTCNATSYYDTRSKPTHVTARGCASSRLSLVQKGLPKQEGQLSLRERRRLKRKEGHNLHNRGVQRLRLKTKRSISAARDNRAERLAEDAQLPQISYEVVEPQTLNSGSMAGSKWFDSYYQRDIIKAFPRFRGHRKAEVGWYCADARFLSHVKRKFTADDSYYTYEDEEEVETVDNDLEAEYCPSSSQSEFSLLDWLGSAPTRHSRQRTSSETEESARKVNPASSQRVKKYGKGMAIYVDREDVEKNSDDDGMDTTDVISDTDNDSGLHSADEADMAVPASSVVYDYAEELSKFDNSFASCFVPACEFSAACLRDNFGQAVQFGNCVPLTARFNMAAVNSMLGMDMREEGGLEEGECWLVFQQGEPVTWTLAEESGDVACLKMKLCNSHGECDVEEANERLASACDALSCDQVKVIPLRQLLFTVCNITAQCSLHSAQPNQHKPEQKSEVLDMFPPHEHFVGEAVVCDVNEAYQHIVSSLPEQANSQNLADDNVTDANSLTWCDMECSVCFSRIDLDTSDLENVSMLSPFVAMTACGHSFCRQCWQHHLVAGVFEGQTILHCMAYKCKTVVGETTLQSFLPDKVFARWQQRVRNKEVEKNCSWRWCPNANCGRLAKTGAPDIMKKSRRLKEDVKRKVEKSYGDKPHTDELHADELHTDESHVMKMEATKTETASKRRQTRDKRNGTIGVPITCLCSKRWCWDCGRDAHWPVTCTNYDTYLKMLKQNGDEDGVRYLATQEIAYVQVKRCPECNYPIEKNGGCSHMSCCQCYKSFCWVCLASWDNHYTFGYKGCSERGEETIELDNDKLYPLPIEYYKKAVYHRHFWKDLDRARRRTIAEYSNLFTLLQTTGKIEEDEISDDAVGHVVNALLFLKKANMVLELAYVLLSNSPRRHPQAKILQRELLLLEFISDRLKQMFLKHKKHVLRQAHSLHHHTITGQDRLHHACHRAHHLMITIRGTMAQGWLFEADTERFVRHK